MDMNITSQLTEDFSAARMGLLDIGRRQLLRGTLVTATALAGASVLSPMARAAGGGTITWAKPLETKEFDPHTAILGSSWQLLHVVYDALVGMDANLNPVPSLANSWTHPNPTTYVFQIRTDVKFSNGRKMTADDVVGSLERLMNPHTGSFWLKQIGPVKTLEKTGDAEVTIKLSAPYGPFIDALSATMASVLPMQELKAGTFDPKKDLLGTGPFMVESHVQDDHWVLKRNPHYWQAGLPKADVLNIRIMPADTARIAALRDGTVDVATFEASPDAPLLVRGIPKVTVVTEDSTNYYFLGMNAVWEKSIFRNAKLRQAVALTIDRSRIRELALGGAGEPTTVMAPAFKACDTSKLAYFNRDIARAQTVLKESGAGGASFELVVRNIPADIQMAQVIKENVAEIGLTANIAVIEEGIWVKRAWVDNPSQFEAMITWYAGYSDPAMVTLWWNPAVAGFTAGHVPVNASVDDAIAKALSLAKNDSSRPAALQNLCALLDQEAVKVPLCTRQDTVAFRSDKLRAEVKHIEGYGNTLRGIETYEKL
jgi:peptide/nickel transport system substrate-binding protein